MKRPAGAAAADDGDVEAGGALGEAAAEGHGRAVLRGDPQVEHELGRTLGQRVLADGDGALLGAERGVPGGSRPGRPRRQAGSAVRWWTSTHPRPSRHEGAVGAGAGRLGARAGARRHLSRRRRRLGCLVGDGGVAADRGDRAGDVLPLVGVGLGVLAELAEDLQHRACGCRPGRC